MCGIGGIISSSLPSDKAITSLKKMNDAQAHRGPDAEGSWNDSFAYLGHRRLSIIDLTASGNQPMFSYDKRFVLIYNGELYNYKELRLELQRAAHGSTQKAYVFSTQTDSEVILAAYMRWGKDCVQRFNGMFAFAIYDTAEKNIFIARDRLGIKPLYYSFSNGNFLFASEVRALLRSGLVEKKITKEALVDYLQYQTVHAPDTIIDGIKMLLPGNFLFYRQNEPEIKPYWKIEKEIDHESENKSYTEICNDVKNLFFAGVERRLVADVPFGAFLSGGIDSSAVVAAMSHVSSQKVKTFSVVFDESEFSEARYSRLIAKKFQTDHHEIKLTPSGFLRQLPEALAAMDHPSGDGPNTYIVSKATKNAGITMALSGLGSDELFCGYEIFKRACSLEKKGWINLIPRLFRMPAVMAMKSFGKNISHQKTAEILSKVPVNFTTAYPLSRQILLDGEVKKLLSVRELPMNKVYRFLRMTDLDKKGHHLTKCSIAEISTYMQNILLRDTDQMSMAVALEVRVPFLDHKLVEYVLGVPDKYKYPHSPKKLLTDSLGDLLPREIIDRKKMGFILPWQHWLRHDLRQFCESDLNGLEELGFQPVEVHKLWQRFLAGDPQITWSRIWPIVTLAHWNKLN